MAISKLPTTGLIHGNVSDKVDELVDFVNTPTFDNVVKVDAPATGAQAVFGNTVFSDYWINLRDSSSTGIQIGLSDATIVDDATGQCLIKTGGDKGFAVAVDDSANFPDILNADFVINVAKNAGFGTTNPQYKVDVNGDVNTNGQFRVNGTPIGANLPGFFDIEAANGGTNLPGNTNVSGDFTVTGAAVGDAVVINIEPSLLSKIEVAAAEFDVHAVVTAPNTVRGYFRTDSFITLSVGEGANVKVIK